jgi:Zn-dependent protease
MLSAGILCNIIIALILFFVQNEDLKIFALANVMIACFNLLPFRQFDGGQLRELITVRNVEIEKVNFFITIVNIVDIILIVLILILLYLLGNKNIGVFLTPLAFFIISKFEDMENP